VSGAAAPATGSGTTANLANGQAVYGQTCVICHGEDGTGGHGGGAPLDSVDLATAIQTVADGRNMMPSFRGVLTAEQIRDVTAYVVERLHGH
jgi:mono/diheme cytochrome c family protein